MKRLCLGLLLACISLYGLPGSCLRAAAQQPSPNSEVLILAASSTTEVVEEIAAEFGRLHPDTSIQTSFAASSALAQQIIAGAEADLFLSASTQWADELTKHQLVAEQKNLLGNRLVVVVPVDSTLQINQPGDLLHARIGHLAMADPAAVPAGVYAREALEKLGLWKQLSSRVASGANVRQALEFVARGAAEAGIVYASDATADVRVRVTCEIPPDLTEPIRYPLVLLTRASEDAAAIELYHFLSSSKAATIFARHGFVVLDQGTADEAEASEPIANVAQANTPWWSLSYAEWQALRLSFQVGLCAVVISLPLATMVGYYLARSTARGKWIVELLVNMPLVLPPVVTGLLLLVLFAPSGPIGGGLEQWLGVRIVFSWLGAVIASAVVSFPLLVRSIRLGFQSIDPRLEMAARSLGAGRWDAFRTVSLPLARRGLLAGCVLALARSLGEFGATIMIAGNIVGSTQTIPLAIFSASSRPGGETEVWRLVAISIALAAGALLLSEWLERRHAAREAT